YPEPSYALRELWNDHQSVDHGAHAHDRRRAPVARATHGSAGAEPGLAWRGRLFGLANTAYLAAGADAVRFCQTATFTTICIDYGAWRIDMTIRILNLPLGPLQTNCYVLACSATGQAAVIDPAWDGRTISRA